ncbi:Transcription repressor OFP8 [Linum grandiflorum]
MENRFKTRISRMFGKPFGSSCRTRNLSSDVVEKAVFLPHQHDGSRSGSCRFFSPPVSPPKKNRPAFPTTICRNATCPETAATSIINHCTISAASVRRRRQYPRNRQGVIKSGLVPEDSPVSPLTKSYYEKKQSTKKQGKNKKKKKQSTFQRRESSSLLSSSSLDSAYFGGSNYYWFSTSDEKEEENGEQNGYENDDESDTLFFSSRSFSSSDSSSTGKNQTYCAGKKGKSSEEMGVLQKVKGSFAVVKSSSDPYNDFRKSMVEMIVEKQIFGAKDLEQLLQCFLSLNSDRHHRIIVEVFTEIWETLFANWSFD